MGYKKVNGTSRPASAFKTIFTGAAVAAALGIGMNANAGGFPPDCTVGNWMGGATALTNAHTGYQGASNRRYGGPCGLRVQLDGSAAFLTDNSPVAESSYIARFYAFFGGVTEETLIFSADDGTDDVVQVWYDGGDLTLRVFDSGGIANDLTTSAASGWNSIELVWESAAAADIRFVVNSDDPGDDLTSTVDTSGISIVNAHLGNVSGANGGAVDFDDFDSRRVSRPGRLLVGDANGDGNLTLADLFAVNNELPPLTAYAAGQPDCNEDGSITLADLFCINNLLP